MNGTRIILAVVFSLVLVLSALPVAAVSFNRTFCISRYNSGGSSFVNMTARDTTFCFLSVVGIEETDTVNEMAKCAVRRGSAVWMLEAWLESSNDADVECCAICYNN